MGPPEHEALVIPTQPSGLHKRQPTRQRGAITTISNLVIHEALVAYRSVEETENLATGVVALGSSVVHDAVGGRHDDVAEQTGRQKVDDPLLDVLDLDVEARRHNSALVDAAEEVDADLASAVVVNDLELTDVVVALHDLEELDGHLGSRAHEHLLLATLLSVGDRLQRISEHGHARHLDWRGGW